MTTHGATTPTHLQYAPGVTPFAVFEVPDGMELELHIVTWSNYSSTARAAYLYVTKQIIGLPTSDDLMWFPGKDIPALENVEYLADDRIHAHVLTAGERIWVAAEVASALVVRWWGTLRAATSPSLGDVR